MTNRNRIAELLQRTEDLDPDLERYTTIDPSLGMLIRHPLVFSVVHTPNLNALVNAQLKEKRRAIDAAWENREWHRYVWLHERPYRLDALLEIDGHVTDGNLIDDETYWRLAGEIWVDSENIYQNLDEWRDVFEDPERDKKRYFMSDADRKFLSKTPMFGGLPDTFTVYRGFHNTGAEDGYSWTLDRERACWFAHRLCPTGGQPKVASGIISRRDVFAFMSGRGEQEIVCLPENVCGIEIEKLG